MPLHLHPPACLQAETVSCTEEDGVLTVAFAAACKEGDPPYLILQRALQPGDEDAPYLELSDQVRSAYGHVTAVHLAPTALRIDLDLQGARRLGATCVQLRLQSQGERYPLLANSIRRIFEGVPLSCE
jgi:hypothetical protein